MEESCVARVVSPGRFFYGRRRSAGECSKKSQEETIWRFQGSCSPATASCILWRHITHTGSSSLFSYYVHFAWWNMGSPHILFGLLCPPPDGHTAALFFLDTYSQVMILWHATAHFYFSCVFVISFFFFCVVFQLLFRYICSLPCLLSLSLSFFWLIDHKDDHRQQRSDRSVAGPLHYYFRKRRAALAIFVVLYITKGRRWPAAVPGYI